MNRKRWCLTMYILKVLLPIITLACTPLPANSQDTEVRFEGLERFSFQRATLDTLRFPDQMIAGYLPMFYDSSLFAEDSGYFNDIFVRDFRLPAIDPNEVIVLRTVSDDQAACCQDMWLGVYSDNRRVEIWKTNGIYRNHSRISPRPRFMFDSVTTPQPDTVVLWLSTWFAAGDLRNFGGKRRVLARHGHGYSYAYLENCYNFDGYLGDSISAWSVSVEAMRDGTLYRRSIEGLSGRALDSQGFVDPWLQEFDSSYADSGLTWNFYQALANRLTNLPGSQASERAPSQPSAWEYNSSFRPPKRTFKPAPTITVPEPAADSGKNQ